MDGVKQSNKLCECGCGQFTSIAKQTSRRYGHKLGHPCRFVSGHNNATPVNKRFWQYVARTSGCWLWMGTLQTHGYGQIKDGCKMKRAHRVSWELNVGPVPDGMMVLHKCDVRNCVRPDHLFLGTKLDNTRDMMSKGRQRFGGKSASDLTVSGI